MNQVLRSRSSGQSIPLIALMIVVLFGMVGLSVDVGNTYAQQRSVVRAANASALAGIDAVIRGSDDKAVAKVIRESLLSNGIKLQGQSTSTTENTGPSTGNITLEAIYMDVEGKHISDCQVGACNAVPANTNYIEVQLNGAVDTYFARVVGRPKLPVNSTAYGYRCPPTNGVYPLAVQFSDIDFTKNRFKDKYENNTPYPTGEVGTYTDNDYKDGKIWRRIFLKDNGNLPGSFSWMRWLETKQSGVELAAALTGDGTLPEGFNEAPWPAGYSEAKPDNYPLSPGQLTPGDWIYGDPGLNWSNGGNSSVRPALEALLTNRTVMILPIVNGIAGSGANSQFKMAAFGRFLLVDQFPNDPNNGGISKNGGANAYVDLVYLGPANGSACLVTNIDPRDPGGPPPPPPPTLEVSIPFKINPRYSEPSTPAQPIAYQLVVDVSGSMSWNFDGEGTVDYSKAEPLQNTVGGRNVKCEFANKTSKMDYYDKCSGGPNSSWWRYNERRVYVTKEAIKGFINDLNPEDVMRYTAFSSGTMSGNTTVVPASGFTGDKDLLLKELSSLGSLSGDPYRTSGGTPGPQALAKARDIILQAPTTSPSGKKYRKVIVYLTDGVANVFLNGTTNGSSENCVGYTTTQTLNSPECQIGVSSKNNALRPISAMIDQATKIKEADKDIQIYVLALAGVATDGLSQVASQPSMMQKADKPGFVASVLNTIRGDAEGTSCLAKGGSGFVDRIPSANHSDFTGTYALPSEEYGKATIYNEDGVIVGTYPVKHNAFGGNLSVQVPLQPGNYQISAWLGYKGPDKPAQVSRMYTNLSWNQVTYANRLSFTVGANDSLNQTRVVDNVFVDLDPSVLVCPKK